jgi:hypothetical protein
VQNGLRAVGTCETINGIVEESGEVIEEMPEGGVSDPGSLA